MAPSVEDLADPLWRLRNLYTIKRADDGRLIRFAPRAEQAEVYRMVFKDGIRRLIILKARRLGMSTALDIMLADQMLWNAGTQVSLVDQTAADAERKLATIAKVAVENLPKELREHITVLKDSGSTLEISVAGRSASSFFAGLRARGGTNNWLHISEWGVVAADDPRRSEEIMTGALPSAEHGTVVVETTWKGGRGGLLYGLVKQALETPEADKTDKDWRVVFFPWWKDPTYTLGGEVNTVSGENRKYLAGVEAEIGRKLSDGQKIWYDRQQKALGMFVWREFPSVLEECFKSPVEGAIYADLLDKLRGSGQITQFHPDTSALVNTSWDLGSPVNVVTWYWQVMPGGDIRVIDCDTNLDLTPVQRVAHMMAKGYPLGSHYLPHDAASTNTSGRSFQQELSEAGLRNLKIVPRTVDVWVGINRLRQLLPRFSFRVPACDDGLHALASYSYKPQSATGLVVSEPTHNWASHASDALRMIAEAEAAGMLKTGSAPRGESTVITGFRGSSLRGAATVRR